MAISAVWQTILPEKKDGLTIALDGKTIRSTGHMNSYESPLHIVSVQISELGITFAQKSVDEKSNEIPAVQALIKQLEISGCLVVADALNCQKKTASAVIAGKADYLLCIGAVHTQFEEKGEKTDEWHYYIASRKLMAEELLHHARMEWSEETMHWLLDVHFAEDFCRVEDRNVQQNLNMLRKFAMNQIKIHKERSASKRAVSKIMFDCLLDHSNILKILEN